MVNHYLIKIWRHSLTFAGMRSATLRWIMVGCSVIIAFILVAQLYWLRRVYNLEQQQFKSSVLKSIQGLHGDIHIADDPHQPVKQLVDIVDADTYLVQLDSIPQKDTLRLYLSNEFEDFGVWTDCNVAVFNKYQQQYLYQYYLPAASSKNVSTPKTGEPLIKMGYHYLLLYFPHRGKYIIQEMSFWIVTAVLLLLILIGLSVSLLYLYRQKFLNELQKDFVNNFTHEFKTPLAVMKIAADVMIQPDIIQKPERLARYSAVIKEQTEHLQNQVDRLLKTASVENKKLPVKKEACQLNELIQNALGQIEPFISSRNAVVDFLPDENEPVIHADRWQLQMVIINLVENAIKYSLNQPHIIIELKNGDSDYYSISVKDNGIGIEQKNIKYLFKKFYRVPTGNVHNVTGFGLGLNFVKKVLDAHNGKISIHSVVDIGTEFKIQLPKK
ncbi:MAG: HAMP domain-containing histidine kinase [Chitinophagaceae bacterium]|nr:HAMP domain-containing histidine kinase [Chitinophagaceae bacterium]